MTTSIQPATPAVTVVPLTALADSLPAGEKRVSAEQRAAIIAARKRHMNRRLAP